MNSRTAHRGPLGPGAVGLIAALLVGTAAVTVVALTHRAAAATSLDETDTATDTTEATAADGVLPEDATVFDGEHPGVGNLDRALLRALRAAATTAADDGVAFRVNSGWRSPRYQNRLLREAVERYGSEVDAARWVATADRSAHVAGQAVDLGVAAREWLAEHGAAFGLCRVYDNEPWHFELRPAAVRRGCPARYADPTHDPRLRR